MESTRGTGYKLIEGQGKQNLLDKYINQLADFDKDNGIEVYQISSNLLESSSSIGAERDQTSSNQVSNFTGSTFTNREPSYTNNQDNISSLSELISKHKGNKSNQLNSQTRSIKEFSPENVTETIRGIL